jgi:hypothetical protein
MQPPPVTTNSTGASFQLSMASVNQAQALKNCNALGGHLASYLSFTEQQEVRAVLSKQLCSWWWIPCTAPCLA